MIRLRPKAADELNICDRDIHPSDIYKLDINDKYQMPIRELT
jgi:hypothetical protein